MKHSYEVTPERVARDAVARRHVAQVVFPAVSEIVAKYDGKQGNKRFTKALEAIEGVYVSEFCMCGVLRYEVYYQGPDWWNQQRPDAAPVPGFGKLGVCFVELNGPNKTDRVNAATLWSWCSRYEEDAAALDDMNAGTCESVKRYNEALRDFNAALDAIPAAVSAVWNMDTCAYRWHEIETGAGNVR